MHNLTEGFGTSGVLDVSYLRQNYYGRVNLIVAFANDEVEFKETVKRPKSSVFYHVQDVVGRRVSSDKFYAYVYRFPKSGAGFLDIGEYTEEMMFSDFNKIKHMSYVNQDLFEDIASKSKYRNITKSPFQRFWEFTSELGAKLGQYGWGSLLMDCGYWGFDDKRGKGLFEKHNVPAVLILKDSFLDMLDIVPIQKFRQDPRKRVISQMEQQLKKLETRRNRVAKTKGNAFDKSKPKDDFLSKIERASQIWL